MKDKVLFAVVITAALSCILAFTIVKFMTYEEKPVESVITEVEQVTEKPEHTESIQEERVEDIPNDSDIYNESFEVTVAINQEQAMYFDLSSEWFIIPENLKTMDNVYATIGYIIENFYDNEIPEKFSFDADKDIYETFTTMVFCVVVHGETFDLDIVVDMYNNNAQVNIIEKDSEPQAAKSVQVEN